MAEPGEKSVRLCDFCYEEARKQLRLLRIAYRRACGSPEMPGPDLIDDLAHEIKKQIVATEDLKVESSLFYQDMFSSRKHSYDGVARIVQSNGLPGKSILPGKARCPKTVAENGRWRCVGAVR